MLYIQQWSPGKISRETQTQRQPVFHVAVQHPGTRIRTPSCPKPVLPRVRAPSCGDADTFVRPHWYSILVLLLFCSLTYSVLFSRLFTALFNRLLAVRQLHGTRHTTGHRHGTSTDSTPPFSYCDSVSSEASPLALGQPLVSFSPPFDAAHVGPHRHDNTCGQESSRVVNSSPLFGMRVHHPRTSVPVLETLPESPFSWKGNRENIQPAAATSPASFSRPLLPASLSNSRQGPKPAIDPGADRAEVSKRYSELDFQRAIVRRARVC